MSIKFLVLGWGGILGFWGGVGSENFIFYGREDFSDLISVSMDYGMCKSLHEIAKARRHELLREFRDIAAFHAAIRLAITLIALAHVLVPFSSIRLCEDREVVVACQLPLNTILTTPIPHISKNMAPKYAIKCMRGRMA